MMSFHPLACLPRMTCFRSLAYQLRICFPYPFKCIAPRISSLVCWRVWLSLWLLRRALLPCLLACVVTPFVIAPRIYSLSIDVCVYPFRCCAAHFFLVCWRVWLPLWLLRRAFVPCLLACLVTPFVIAPRISSLSIDVGGYPFRHCAALFLSVYVCGYV